MLTGHLQGAKPFSMFGFLHGLDSQRQALATVCKSEYPKLESELRALQNQENRGILALLLDTLLDLELIKDQVTGPVERDTLLIEAILPKAERDSEQDAGGGSLELHRAG